MKNGTTTTATDLGFAPAPDDVHDWFLQHGLVPERVGSTLLGRDLFVYHHRSPNASDETPTILFLSLVHGNEVFGLVALLHTAQELFLKEQQGDSPEVNLIFFPTVNLDGYLLNRSHPGGCRRSNLRRTCRTSPANATAVCPVMTSDGVDLNRNFVHEKWSRPPPGFENDVCSHTYPGSGGFSEPETQAIRHVVKSNHHLVASLSYHTRRHSSAPPLLIHPYASGRPMDQMPRERLVRYRKFSEALIRSMPNGCAVGTASETIHYNASGTTMDWLDAQGIFAWVHEVVPPCKSRWCTMETLGGGGEKEIGENRTISCVDRVRDDARRNAQVGLELARIFDGSKQNSVAFITAQDMKRYTIVKKSELPNLSSPEAFCKAIVEDKPLSISNYLTQHTYKIQLPMQKSNFVVEREPYDGDYHYADLLAFPLVLLATTVLIGICRCYSMMRQLERRRQERREIDNTNSFLS